MPGKNTNAQQVSRDLQKVVDYFVVYKGREFEPPRGTIIAKLWRERKLSLRHCKAAEAFHEDLVKTFDGDQPRTSNLRTTPVQSSGLRVVEQSPRSKAQKRVQDLIRWLHVHEYRLLELVVSDIHHANQSGQGPGDRSPVFFDLATVGKSISGYSGRAQSMAAATARLQGLLETIAEFYQIDG